MLGPSGFFQTIGDADSPVSTKDLEIIHDSETGFNVLYRGSKNGRFFVYKALKPEYRGNPLYEELLKKDFNIGFSLTHNGICQYYGMVTLPDIGSCIVMEWVDGCSLEHLLSKGRMEKALARKIISELCEAMDYMHRKQVIHRDLKPENILVTYNGQNVKVIDFGLSDADSYNAFKAPAGTRMYASPELLAGEQIDNRSDIYSLGVIINELCGNFGHVASICMRRDRERRPATAAEVMKAMNNLWKRNLVLTVAYTCILVAVASGVWWCAGNIGIPRIPDQPEDTPAYEEHNTAMPAEKEEPVAESETGPAVEQEPETAEKVFSDNEKATESIDAAALEDLFNEASDMLL